MIAPEPSIARQLARAPARSALWVVTTPLGIAAFAVWAALVGTAMCVVTVAWRLQLWARRLDYAPMRWGNPALPLIGAWTAGFRAICFCAWGVRFRGGTTPANIPDDEVALLLITHGPAAPAIMVAGDVEVRVARGRFFAPTKKELTPLLRWPASAVGIVVPIDRRAGESAAAALERELHTIPLAGTAAVIFPEGTRIKRSRVAASHERAREHGHEPLQNHLEPHPRGSYTMIRALMARAADEGLRLRVYFLTYALDRAGWGERLGPLHTMGAEISWEGEEVTDEAVEAASDLSRFASWLRRRFEAADQAMSPGPFLD